VGGAEVLLVALSLHAGCSGGQQSLSSSLRQNVSQRNHRRAGFAVLGARRGRWLGAPRLSARRGPENARQRLLAQRSQAARMARLRVSCGRRLPALGRATTTILRRCIRLPVASDPPATERAFAGAGARRGARCLSIDLEVGRGSGRIHQLAGVAGDSGDTVVFPPGALGEALERLDRLADSAAFLVGHNLIAFDLAHLRALQPNLRLLEKPAIDTLRINPLAFPRNPYHHLVKHYQDGQLLGNRRNDPLLDAELALRLFADQQDRLKAMQESSPDLLIAWHWLTTRDGSVSGLNGFFMAVRRTDLPNDVDAKGALARLLDGAACRQASAEVIAQVAAKATPNAWPLAHALAWLAVAGGNSVLPPWVRYQFPEPGWMIDALRDTACDDPICVWCRREHDALIQLKHWFGPHYSFRPEPADPVSGQFLQQGTQSWTPTF